MSLCVPSKNISDKGNVVWPPTSVSGGLPAWTTDPPLSEQVILVPSVLQSFTTRLKTQSSFFVRQQRINHKTDSQASGWITSLPAGFTPQSATQVIFQQWASRVRSVVEMNNFEELLMSQVNAHTLPASPWWTEGHVRLLHFCPKIKGYIICLNLHHVTNQVIKVFPLFHNPVETRLHVADVNLPAWLAATTKQSTVSEHVSCNSTVRCRTRSLALCTRWADDWRRMKTSCDG